jgi:hypothetical protein
MFLWLPRQPNAIYRQAILSTLFGDLWAAPAPLAYGTSHRCGKTSCSHRVVDGELARGGHRQLLHETPAIRKTPLFNAVNARATHSLRVICLIGPDKRRCRQLSVKSASRSVDRSALGGACSLEQTEQDVTEIERSGQQTQAGSEAIGIDILERRFNIAVTLLPDRDRGCE